MHCAADVRRVEAHQVTAMPNELASEVLAPCRKGNLALTQGECTELLRQLPGWTLQHSGDTDQLQRRYGFRNFADALAFANAVGALADTADHHPALTVEWGKVTVQWWTHVIGGVHRNDFIMAARTEQLYP